MRIEYFPYIIFLLSCAVINHTDSIEKNPLLYGFNETINFDKVKLGDINQATAFTLNKANQTLLDILNVKHTDRTFENTLLKIDDLYNDVSKTWNIIGLFSSVHPSTSIRKEADKNDLLIQDYMFQLSMRKDLYKAVLQYSKREKALNLRGERKRFLDGELRDFERSGLGLSEDDRRELRKIQNRFFYLIPHALFLKKEDHIAKNL